MNGKGTLTVRVYISRAKLPLSDATVVVTQRSEGGKYQLLSVQATDRSGSTRPVDIPTPLLEDSIQPGHGTPPYAVCDVWAEHPGYAMLLVEGVQIFDGVDTLQEMELSPLSEGESSLVQEQIREITGQSCAQRDHRTPGPAERGGRKHYRLLPGLCKKCGLQ